MRHARKPPTYPSRSLRSPRLELDHLSNTLYKSDHVPTEPDGSRSLSIPNAGSRSINRSPLLPQPRVDHRNRHKWINMRPAPKLKRVRANKGAPGVDGMTVGQLPEYLKEQWPAIREQLLSNTYQPKPVRVVEIPKASGGTRKLGIPICNERLSTWGLISLLEMQRRLIRAT
jgi:RNA-directed DNA polymerase